MTLFVESFVLLILCLRTIFVSSQIKSVLVIGASGRVGRCVTKTLISQGYSVKSLVRNEPEAKNIDELKGSTLIQGDVLNLGSLIDATTQCDCVISVHGMRPPRFTKLSDLFRHPSLDPTHPYNVNYVGTKNILEAMCVNQVRKLVRITGATVGIPLLPNIFKVLFAFLLSCSSKWHEESERLIRANKNIDYTVIRPTGIVAEPPNNRELALLQGDDYSSGAPRIANREKLKLPAKIPIQDLADLICLSLADPRLSRTTVICTSKPLSTNASPSSSLQTTWSSLIGTKKIKPDYGEVRVGPYKVAIALYSTLFFAVTAIMFKISVTSLNLFIRLLSR